MVAVVIGKTILIITVSRRLYLNDQYTQVPRVCDHLLVQSRWTRLKGCHQHGSWTVLDWGKMFSFTEESRFVLKCKDKFIRLWREQVTHNWPENITERHEFVGGIIIVWTGPLAIDDCLTLYRLLERAVISMVLPSRMAGLAFAVSDLCENGTGQRIVLLV
ncbi:transposable element Tcb1 transposase [Trichonephila clavipes]|nr:transposable element Tcb1 transposase [Trichonephila clavipes]